jgi:anti-sigma B factor antagonist
MFEISMPEAGHIVMSGRFDASQVSKAQALFDTVGGSCVIDCSGLEYISSAGLGVLLGAYKRLDEQGASLKLTGMRKLVRDVFRYSRMDTIFEVE